MRPLFIAAILAMFLAGCAHVSPEREAFSPPKGFNGVALLARNRSSAALSESYGFANVDTGQRFDRATKSQIGSASKFLTAIVVLRLVQDRKLSLDEPIVRWLPFLAGSDNGGVTLRQLMSNTSGIPDGVMISYRRDPDFTSTERSAAEATKIFGTGKMEFRPGTSWDYSLTNWVIVRAIVESATGQSFEATFQRELVDPLGLRDTGIPGPDFPETATFAQNYVSLQPIKTKDNRVPTYAAAAGTIYSTATDLRAVVDAVFNEKFLTRESRDQLLSVNFEKEGYALGGRVVDLPTTRYKLLWEPGETSNYRALIAYEPGSGACVILLDNAGTDPGSMGDSARAAMNKLLH